MFGLLLMVPGNQPTYLAESTQHTVASVIDGMISCSCREMTLGQLGIHCDY
jgi:hypothetical protein